jgi:hypothetical protein
MAAAGCGSGSSNPDAPGPPPLCNDGEDNDNDTLADYPADPGCDSELDDTEDNAPIAMCSDDRDNDGDGLVDFPNDPGCFNPLQDSEIDDCPDGPNCPACANGQDDDDDGQTDYPADSGCKAASGGDEYAVNPAACGPGMVVQPIMGDATGTLQSGGTSEQEGSCGGIGDEVAYEIRIQHPTVIVATTDTEDTTVNTVLYVRSDCMDPKSEIVCNEDLSPTNQQSTITADLMPGIYYIIVDNHNSVSAGDFELKVESFAGSGSPCTIDEDCFGDLECRVPHGQTEMVCVGPVCNDGIDDDEDGTPDYPGDPGCAAPEDDDETDDCPDGPNCPACSNDLDDDADTFFDYPDDAQCPAASGTSESCIDVDGVINITSVPFSGTTVGATDDYDFSCTSSSTNGGLDRIHAITLPPTTTVTITSEPNSFDASVAVLNSTCSGTPLVCNDTPESATLTNAAAGTYYFVVDGWSDGSGTYSVSVSGRIVNGESCESPLAQSGALTCGNGYSCQGAVGSRTCQLAQCNDAVDADGDGFPGFPTDPGCTSASDGDESDDCPDGPTCPACSNDLDDDGDTLFDYPADTSCPSAAGISEACVDVDGVIAVTSVPLSGTNVGAHNDYNFSCTTSSSDAGLDVVYQLDLPQTSTIQFTTEPNDFDQALTLLNSTCGGTPLSCTDPETFTQTNLAAGRYYLVVDAWSTGTGTFSLNVSGTIVNGGNCELPLVQSGALTCAAGSSCQGAVGSRTCQPAACGDTIDADGDGFPGYPTDPGCTSIADADETDDCPSGPNCPDCSNDLDDDGDLMIDYPMDPNCASASFADEAGCALETDPILVITAPVTMGTTTGMTNDTTPSCQTNTTTPDVGLRLDVPVMLSTLTADTNGSTGADGTFDTILTIRNASCTMPELACDDDINFPANAFSEIVSTNVAPGSYLYIVDGYQSDNIGPFQLNVHGVAVPGAACTSPLFASGVLACATGETCTAGVCTP